MCAATSQFNILILINVRWWNANAYYAVNLARILYSRGHRVWVGCAAQTPAYKKARQWGLPIVDIDFAARNPLMILSSFRKLLKFIREQGITVINSQRPEDSTFGWIAQRLTDIKHIVTRGDQRSIGKGLLGVQRYRQADGVVLTSEALLHRNPEVLNPIYHKITVIHGSADERRFSPDLHPRLSLNALRVGWVGRLDPVKAPDTFLRAAAIAARQCDHLEFILAGAPAGLKPEAIRQQAEKLGVACRLTLLPKVTDIAATMAAMDLGVITSTGSEVISRVLLEFLALGKPVLGTQINAIGEIIRPGVNGQLFSPGDHKTLARLMVDWADNPDLRRTLAAGARRTYLNNYSEDQVYRQFRRVLGEMGL
jgi:glycosyltransferase involved in cell wall biosynthesis